MSLDVYSVKAFAQAVNKSNRTVQRRIEKYNKENNTCFPFGLKDLIDNEFLISFLKKEFSHDNQDHEEADILLSSESRSVGDYSSTMEVQIKDKTDLQEKLSSDWLIVVVLLTILCADMLAFSIIGHQEFSDRIPFAGVLFAIIGFATGIGSVVTYNRIENKRLAETWKWFFGFLQFLVFSFAVNEKWFYGETTMTLMFVLVFISVQRSIKK